MPAGCDSFLVMRSNQSISRILSQKDEKENKLFLKWLGFVYPRFKKFYDILESETIHDSTIIDQYEVPVEMFCKVNIPIIVSSINLR